MDLMSSQPVFLRKLIARQQLELLTSPRPSVEKIPAPALRRNQHVVQTLPVGVAVEPRVLRNRAENRPGIQLVPIGQMQGDALLIQVVRGRIGDEGINVDVLLPKRKSIDRKSQDLLGRKNELESRKRVKALFLVDVVWPRQSANRGLFHVVLEDFREK